MKQVDNKCRSGKTESDVMSKVVKVKLIRVDTHLIVRVLVKVKLVTVDTHFIVRVSLCCRSALDTFNVVLMTVTFDLLNEKLYL